ncbi:MAG: glucosaminidase domain-containing protein [Agriterribacter sp.]
MTDLEYQVFSAGIDGGMTTEVASLLLAQAKHESAGFTSSVFKANNNAFGYKYVGQSGAMQGSAAPASEGGYYAKYATVYDSATEVVNWWKRRIKSGAITGWKDINTPEKYAHHLKQSNYFGDTLANYTAALKKWFGSLLDSSSPNNVLAESAIMIVGFFVACYYLLK